MNIVTKTKGFFPLPVKQRAITIYHPSFQSFLYNWNKLLYSATEQQYKERLAQFKIDYPVRAVEYVDKIWLYWKEKIVMFWLNNFLPISIYDGIFESPSSCRYDNYLIDILRSLNPRMYIQEDGLKELLVGQGSPYLRIPPSSTPPNLGYFVQEQEQRRLFSNITILPSISNPSTTNPLQQWALRVESDPSTTQLGIERIGQYSDIYKAGMERERAYLRAFADIAGGP
ncbi:hypothetical protein CJF32_00001345 [Rutstroemia sp. NJR-2017a WRK4]|nr:hypothetical protein CJF32_00001345 [Rutstroemia sp. NJR-2017a WRK4]